MLADRCGGAIDCAYADSGVINIAATAILSQVILHCQGGFYA